MRKNCPDGVNLGVAQNAVMRTGGGEKGEGKLIPGIHPLTSQYHMPLYLILTDSKRKSTQGKYKCASFEKDASNMKEEPVLQRIKESRTKKIQRNCSEKASAIAPVFAYVCEDFLVRHSTKKKK